MAVSMNLESFFWGNSVPTAYYLGSILGHYYQRLKVTTSAATGLRFIVCRLKPVSVALRLGTLDKSWACLLESSVSTL